MADIASSELNLRELRILHALLHERSITRTAELLATTQPGISKVLRHLRAQFGDPLFVRNGHAMQPTAKALEIADQVRTLLGVADSLRASATAFDPVRSDRTFSLLLTDVGMIRFLPPLIAHVAAIAPRVNIRAMPLIHASSNSSWKPVKPIWRSAPFQKPRAICGVSDYISTAMSPSSARDIPKYRLAGRAQAFSPSGISSSPPRRPVMPRTEPPSACSLRRYHRGISCYASRASLPAPSSRPKPRAHHLAGQSGQAPCRAARAGRIRNPDRLPRIEISQYWHERYHRDAAHRWFRSITSELFGATASMRGRTTASN